VAEPTSRAPVIAGLGLTEMGHVYGRSATSFAAEAVRLAVADAGMTLSDLDGLLVSPGTSGGLGVGLQRVFELRDLRLQAEMQAFGATAAAMVETASLAVASGAAGAVACVFADAPLRPGRSSGEVYSTGGVRRNPKGWGGLLAGTGVVGANTLYVLAARRHMLRYGTKSEHFGAVAVAQREWARLNPLAQMREPLSLEDHQASRLIVDPFHLYDCCLVSNGGVAVVVTTAQRARGLAQPPVHVLGWAQCHPGRLFDRDENFGLVTGAARSGPEALAMAGVGIGDIEIAELYDCYTYTVVVSLEDYGYCDKGEGGPFVASGVVGPQGKLKLNTGGGQLSAYYMWGMTPLAEAVIQVRGQAGERQVHPHDLALVSGNGGILDHHATLVLGTQRP
jgi:acetyl-CoA acetyltransferase